MPDEPTSPAPLTGDASAVPAAPGPASPGTPDSAPPPPPPAGEPPAAWQELALRELHQRRSELESEIAQLESRRQAIAREIAGSYAGQADAVARRLKGFQDYLVGALQDLAVAAEQIELVPQPVLVQPSPIDAAAREEAAAAAGAGASAAGAGSGGPFAGDAELIRSRLTAFQGQPDFYAEPWKLRRTLEAAGATALENWFLEQAGRGAQPSGGSRSRNGLVTAAAIAILGELYGDRFQTLVLAGEPERLGEWRRSLQDCLGLEREDFGPNSGIVLLERPEAVIERADRLEERGELPFIVIDAAEPGVEIAILQFPLWLAFAPGPDELMREEEYY